MKREIDTRTCLSKRSKKDKPESYSTVTPFVYIIVIIFKISLNLTAERSFFSAQPFKKCHRLKHG